MTMNQADKEIRTNFYEGNDFRFDKLYSQAGLSQGFWIKSKSSDILIDCGDGILRDVISKGFNFKALDAILITHGHFDHMGGLYSLLCFFRMIGRKKKLPIIFPAKSKEILAVIETFQNLYEDSTSYEIDLIEAEDRQISKISDIEIESVYVRHCGSIDGGPKGESQILDPIPAIGFRIKIGNEILGISGDTGYTQGLEYIAKNADLAIIEATFPDSDRQSDEMLTNVHLNHQLARKAGELAKNYFLCHKILHR